MKKWLCVLILGACAIGLLAPSVSHVAWWYDPGPNGPVKVTGSSRLPV